LQWRIAIDTAQVISILENDKKKWDITLTIR
jgi:hypothetical protein